MDEMFETLIPTVEDLEPEQEAQQPQQEAPEPTAEPTSEPLPEAPAARDYAAEVAELLREHPELRGKPLPDDVTRAAVDEGTPLPEAYRAYAERETRAELNRLREENRVYRQNAEAARRAPVQGVADSGAETKGIDPFLAGFNSW